MIIIIRGSDWNHNKAAHTTALLAGCGAMKRTRKSIILQFCNRVPVDNILIGKRLRETDIKDIGFMFEDTGVDALCRRLSKERLQKEVFDSCCTPILNAENLLDVATESKKESFEKELVSNPADIESLIKQTADFYDDVYIFANGKNPAFCEALEKAIKIENLPSKTFVCIRQGMKEDVTGAEDPCYIVTGYDENSTFDLKYLKSLYKTRKIFNIPYNTEYKDAYNNGALMNFIGKNEKISSDDINYPLFKAIDAILNEFGGDAEEIKDEPAAYEDLDKSKSKAKLSPYKEPRVRKETTKGLFGKKEDLIVPDDLEEEEFEPEEILEEEIYEKDDDLEEAGQDSEFEFEEEDYEDDPEDEDIEAAGEENEEDEEEAEEEKAPTVPKKKEKKKLSFFGFGKKKEKKQQQPEPDDTEDDEDFEEEDLFEEEDPVSEESFEEDEDEEFFEEPEPAPKPEKKNVNKQKQAPPAPAVNESAGAWTCPECGEENPGKSKFCVECGTKRPDKEKEKKKILPAYWTCSFCGEANPARVKTCLECGAKRPGQAKRSALSERI